MINRQEPTVEATVSATLTPIVILLLGGCRAGESDRATIAASEILLY